jgi:hypothetical protein
MVRRPLALRRSEGSSASIAASALTTLTNTGQGQGADHHRQAGSPADLTPDLAGRTSSTTTLTTLTNIRSEWSAWTGGELSR